MIGDYTVGNPKRINLADVNNLTLEDLGLTRDNVDLQMFGITTIDKKTGKTLPTSYYNQAIKAAVGRFEKELDIVIRPRLIEEEKDFNPARFQNNTQLRLNCRPILQVEEVRASSFFGNGDVKYPQGQYKVSTLGGLLYVNPGVIGNYMNTNMANNYGGRGNVFGPATNGYGGNNYYSRNGGLQVGGFNSGGQRNIPFMFHVNYVAGMLPQAEDGIERDWEMGVDLQASILKAASCDIFKQWGRLILGPGIESKSISMDAISEAIGTTQSAMYGGAYADIRQLEEDIDAYIKAMKSKYYPRTSIL